MCEFHGRVSDCGAKEAIVPNMPPVSPPVIPKLTDQITDGIRQLLDGGSAVPDAVKPSLDVPPAAPEAKAAPAPAAPPKVSPVAPGAKAAPAPAAPPISPAEKARIEKERLQAGLRGIKRRSKKSGTDIQLRNAITKEIAALLKIDVNKVNWVDSDSRKQVSSEIKTYVRSRFPGEELESLLPVFFFN